MKKPINLINLINSKKEKFNKWIQKIKNSGFTIPTTSQLLNITIQQHEMPTFVRPEPKINIVVEDKPRTKKQYH